MSVVCAAAEAQQAELTFRPALNSTSRRLAAAGEAERAARGGVQRGRAFPGGALPMAEGACSPLALFALRNGLGLSKY